MSQLPAPPLPDQTDTVNLFQWVSNTALEEPDPALHARMNLRVLFAFGIAVWVKMEIHVRIMKHHDPATMLVSFKRCLCDCTHDQSPSRLLLHLPTSFVSCGLHAAITSLPTRFNRAQTFPITYVYKISHATLTDCLYRTPLVYCSPIGDCMDVLYDWLSDVIDWEIGK